MPSTTLPPILVVSVSAKIYSVTLPRLEGRRRGARKGTDPFRYEYDIDGVGHFTVDVIDSVAAYVDLVRSIFDFDKVGKRRPLWKRVLSDQIPHKWKLDRHKIQGSVGLDARGDGSLRGHHPRGHPWCRPQGSFEVSLVSFSFYSIPELFPSQTSAVATPTPTSPMPRLS